MFSWLPTIFNSGYPGAPTNSTTSTSNSSIGSLSNRNPPTGPRVYGENAPYASVAFPRYLQNSISGSANTPHSLPTGSTFQPKLLDHLNRIPVTQRYGTLMSNLHKISSITCEELQDILCCLPDTDSVMENAVVSLASKISDKDNFGRLISPLPEVKQYNIKKILQQLHARNSSFPQQAATYAQLLSFCPQPLRSHQQPVSSISAQFPPNQPPPFIPSQSGTQFPNPQLSQSSTTPLPYYAVYGNSNNSNDNMSNSNYMIPPNSANSPANTKNSDTLQISKNLEASSIESSHPPDQFSTSSATSQSSESTCVVCLDKPADYVVLECGHLCVCKDCSKMIKSCPICRGRISRTIRIFKT